MERKGTLVVGAPRQGKTYYCEQQAIKYARAGGTSIAYNVGMPKDFKDFISITLITPESKVIRMRGKGLRVKPNELPQVIEFFEITDTGKLYHISDFCKLLKGKCVKIERLNAMKQEENLFFAAIYKYFYNCFIVLDDFRAVTRHGLSAQFIQLVSRQNHCGKDFATGENVGVDLAYIYHSFDTVTQEMYVYANSVVQFKTAREPNVKDNREMDDILKENYFTLRDLPKYSRFEVDCINYTKKQITFKH